MITLIIYLMVWNNSIEQFFINSYYNYRDYHIVDLHNLVIHFVKMHMVLL